MCTELLENIPYMCTELLENIPYMCTELLENILYMCTELLPQPLMWHFKKALAKTSYTVSKASHQSTDSMDFSKTLGKFDNT
jgi:hypothetical protein